MMQKKEVEIEIKSNGDVKVHIQGIKGPKCLEYAKLFEKVVGPIKDQSLTSEYYEPETHIGIDVSQENSS